jgi:hypothetical protein
MRVLPLVLLLAVPAFAQQPSDAPTRMAALIKADPIDFNPDGLSRTDLLKLKFQLQESRPGLVSPIVMIGLGAAFDFLGLVFLTTTSVGYSAGHNIWVAQQSSALGGVSTSPSALSYTGWVVSSAMLVVGSLMVACGAIRLGRYLPRRRLAAFKIDLVDAEFAKQAEPPASPPASDLPPPGEPVTR